jgi:protein-tyrosine-phosphatase
MRMRVLFICRENAVQSPAAEALLRAIGGDVRFEAASVGTAPGARFDSKVVASLQAHGIAPPSGTPRGLDAVAGKAFDYVVSLSDDVQESALSLRSRERMHWPFALDVGGDLAYRRLVVGLRRRIELFVTVVDKERGPSK